MVVARVTPTLTLLADGRVLVAGGWDLFDPLRSAEIFDPGAGRFGIARSMSRARAGHTATTLADGSVLLAGGSGASMELFAAASGLEASEAASDQAAGSTAAP